MRYILVFSGVHPEDVSVLRRAGGGRLVGMPAYGAEIQFGFWWCTSSRCFLESGQGRLVGMLAYGADLHFDQVFHFTSKSR